MAVDLSTWTSVIEQLGGYIARRGGEPDFEVARVDHDPLRDGVEITLRPLRPRLYVRTVIDSRSLHGVAKGAVADMIARALESLSSGLRGAIVSEYFKREVSIVDDPGMKEWDRDRIVRSLIWLAKKLAKGDPQLSERLALDLIKNVDKVPR